MGRAQFRRELLQIRVRRHGSFFRTSLLFSFRSAFAAPDLVLRFVPTASSPLSLRSIAAEAPDLLLPHCLSPDLASISLLLLFLFGRDRGAPSGEISESFFEFEVWFLDVTLGFVLSPPPAMEAPENQTGFISFDLFDEDDETEPVATTIKENAELLSKAHVHTAEAAKPQQVIYATAFEHEFYTTLTTWNHEIRLHYCFTDFGFKKARNRNITQSFQTLSKPRSKFLMMHHLLKNVVLTNRNKKH